MLLCILLQVGKMRSPVPVPLEALDGASLGGNSGLQSLAFPAASCKADAAKRPGGGFIPWY